MKTRILLVLFIFSLSFNLLYSQDDKPKHRFEGSDKKGKITGQVVDKESNSPIESASVQIFRLRDTNSVAGGTATDKKGNFVIENVRIGKYMLKVSFIGYSTGLIKELLVMPDNLEIDVGIIKIEPGSEMTTKEIEVTAELPLMQNEIDKRVYNVEKSIVSESGSATDVLKNIPSVTVDADGNISLRGSGNVKILINGRPSGIMASDKTIVLDQIPANSIESIEIMNNPSSKYDPEGMSGIINIVLKKNKLDDKLGYSGNLSLNAGTRDKYNGSFGINFRKGKFSLFGNYNFRLMNFTGYGNSYRQSSIFSSTTFYDQNSDFRNRMTSHLGSLGFDYEIDKNNSLNLTSTYNNRDRRRVETALYEYLDGNSIITQKYNRYGTEDESDNSLDVALNYKLKFKKPKKELTVDFQYSGSREKGPSDITQIDFFTQTTTLKQNDITNENTDEFSLQANYYNPIAKDKSHFEAGFKSSLKKLNEDYQSQYLDLNTSQWIYNSLISNDFNYNEQINAAYGIFQNKLKGFGYQAGVRLEAAFTKSTQVTMSQEFENNYFNFFPTIYLTQDLGKSNEIQLSYVRRINRPRTGMLNPFIDYSDPQNLRKGNPYLKPEYINAFELSYQKYFTTISLTNSIFYRIVNNVINRFVTVNDTGVSMITFLNMNKAISYGLEFVVAGNLFKWWNMNANASYFRTQVQGSNGSAELNNDSYSWSGKLISNMSVPKFFDVMIAYFYTGKMVTAQGYMDPMQSMDIAFKKDFLDKKISFTLRASDVFNTMKFNMHVNDLTFTGWNNRKRDSRAVYLTFSYRFGTDQKKHERRQRKKDNNEDNNNQPEDF